MRKSFVLLTATLLIGCGNKSENMQMRKLSMFDVEEPAGPSQDSAMAAGPRIAYSYTTTYSFDRRTVGEVQGKQLALCRELGTARCLVVKSSLSALSPDEHVVNSDAVLLIDARLASQMNQRLDAIAVAGGATPANHLVEAEDVTRQVIDTDAKVRAKQALAERLLGIIRSGKGNVGELVQAERAYATTQEELDAARGQQAELAQRVAMSRFTITYAFDDTPGRNSPVRGSLASAGETLSKSIATLVTAIVAGLPWVIAAGLALAFARWIRRRMGWRWPRRRVSQAPEAPLENVT